MLHVRGAYDYFEMLWIQFFFEKGQMQSVDKV